MVLFFFSDFCQKQRNGRGGHMTMIPYDIRQLEQIPRPRLEPPTPADGGVYAIFVTDVELKLQTELEVIDMEVVDARDQDISVIAEIGYQVHRQCQVN
jgi:hypothetical protein